MELSKKEGGARSCSDSQRAISIDLDAVRCTCIQRVYLGHRQKEERARTTLLVEEASLVFFAVSNRKVTSVYYLRKLEFTRLRNVTLPVERHVGAHY